MSPTYCIIPTSSSSCSRPFSFEWKHIILLTGGLLPHAARCQVDQLQLTKIPQKISVKIHIELSVTVFCQFKLPLFVTWNKIPFSLVTEINIWEMICLAIYMRYSPIWPFSCPFFWVSMWVSEAYQWNYCPKLSCFDFYNFCNWVGVPRLQTFSEALWPVTVSF